MDNGKPMNLPRCGGISMVELLVAMVVGLFLLTGILQVYTANLTATTAISGFSSQQENARIAINNLAQSLRFAGHYGGADRRDIGVLGSLSVTGIGACNHAWVTDIEQPIRGYEGASAIGSVADFPAGCIASGEYVPQSDIVAVRYGSPYGWGALGALTADKVYLRAGIAGGETGGEIFRGADASQTRLGNGSDGIGVYNYEYKTEVYFLRPCSELNGSNCDDGISTLVKIGFDGTALSAEAVAEGVEQFQIEYGIDTDVPVDYSANVFRTADNVANWDDVVSARFSIVVRSDQADASYQDTDTYTLAGDYSYTPASSDDNFRRKVFTKVIQLRNLSRG